MHLPRVLSALLLTLPLAAAAQTYFYVEQLSVSPAAPTIQDFVTISLTGGLSSTGAYVVSSTASVSGNVVTLDVVAADPGGFAVIVPHTRTIMVGQLPAGTYNVMINGVHVADLAPQPQHVFTVSGGQSPACDSLDIPLVRWSPFDEGLIEVTAANWSSDLFGYPGFVLLDGQGDTLGQELVNYFGIGTDPQVHTLIVPPGAAVPAGPFLGTLHLWTSFYSDAACTFTLPLDLCPQDPCVPLAVHIVNQGVPGAVSSPFNWTITGAGGTVEASGTLELGPVDADTAFICLPPGDHVLAMTQPQPVGGQLIFGMGSGPYGSGTIQELFLPGAANQQFFTFFGACVDPGQGVPPVPDSSALRVWEAGGMVFVAADRPLGEVDLLDASGRMLHAERGASNLVGIDRSALPAGVYIIRQVSGGAVRTVRVVLG